MMFWNDSVLILVEGLKYDDAGSECLGVFSSVANGLYTAIMKKLSILIRAAGSFIKNPIKKAPFHALTFYASPKMFLMELKTLFDDHHTDSALQLIACLNTPTSHKRSRSTQLL